MRPSAVAVRAPGRGQLSRRLRPLVVALAGLTPLLMITGCDPLMSHTTGQQITVAAVPGIDNANLFLAQHDGYFTKLGLTVKILKYSSVSAEISALTAGTVNVIAADYGNMFFEQASPNHADYKVLADGYDAAPGVVEILTLPDSTVKNPDDLAGLTIPVPNSEPVGVQKGEPGSLALASAVSVLQSDGVNLAAVNWQPMPQAQEINELVHKQVQAIMVTGTSIYQAQQEGAVELIDACSGPTAGIPLDGFFATKGWLAENDNLAAAKAFQQGIYNADAAAAMPGPIQAVLPRYAGLSKEEADLVATGIYPLSTITANIQRTAALMNNEGMTKFDVNVAAMVVR